MRPRYAMVWAAAVLLLLLGGGRAVAQTTSDLFDPNVLHEIRIDIAPVDWQTLKEHFLDNSYYTGNFSWRYQGRLIIAEDIAIRSRGTGSRSSVKPGLRVDFDRNVPNQTFLGLKSVILRNNTQDPSMMHERLTMLLFTRMGSPASREAHTRFYVNDQYIGLYTIVESVDKDFLRRLFNDNDGFLYKYDYPADAAPYKFEYRGSNPALYSPLPFKPETHERDPNPAPLEAWIRAMNQSSDADFQRAMADYVDLRQFLTHVAVEQFVADRDGFIGDFGMNNYYIYRLTGRNFHRFIAWDKSEAFKQPTRQVFRNATENVLMKRALSFPELKTYFMEQVWATAMSAGGPGGYLEQEIDREYNQIRQAAIEDPNKQCFGPNDQLGPCTNEQFEADVAALRQFARERNNTILTELVANGFQVPGGGPRLNDGGAVNGATFQAGTLAPGMLISVFGERLGTTTAQAASLPIPTVLGGVSIQINGILAPVLFTSPGQVNIQVPWQVAQGTASITASVNGVLGNTITTTIGAVSPGVFAVVHADSSAVSAGSPAVAGEVLVVYATGLGAVTGSVTTGQAAPGNPPASTTQAASVTIGGVTATVEFSGLTPGYVGLYQVNVRVPTNVAAGERTPLVMSIGGQSAPPVQIATR